MSNVIRMGPAQEIKRELTELLADTEKGKITGLFVMVCYADSMPYYESIGAFNSDEYDRFVYAGILDKKKREFMDIDTEAYEYD